MSVTIRNNRFGQFRAAINREMRRRLVRSGDEVVEVVRKSISVPYPPASRPGRPPHLRTGELRGSIESTSFGDKVTIGATAPHAEYLQYGTTRMAARPFLDTGFASAGGVVRRIMTAVWRWTG